MRSAIYKLRGFTKCAQHPCGGFPSLHHNELRDVTASLMSEVCNPVSVEPCLQPLSGEVLRPRSAITDDNARSDIKADGFWSCRQQSSYFDIKVPLLLAIIKRHCSHVIAALKQGREGRIKIVLFRWNMDLSHLSSSQHPVVWVLRPQLFIGDWPPLCHQNVMNITVRLCFLLDAKLVLL